MDPDGAPCAFAIAMLTEDADARRRAVGRVEVPDPVVGEANAGKVWVGGAERASHRPGEGGDRAVPFPGHDDSLPVHGDLHGRLRGDLPIPVLDEDPVGLEIKERLLPSLHVPDEQIERAVGGLEVESLMPVSYTHLR